MVSDEVSEGGVRGEWGGGEGGERTNELATRGGLLAARDAPNATARRLE